ncbi:hypothetical protein LTR91_019092 [Friedmanniomyces endolithicus]|uniref:Uncharacterized protein n=1 Tax=Friedmanniomyces endolithicus TaxID=329885 RepID=A0AAN6HFH9_9PEZI|nr:hypothetical protein LTR57_019748 [Friedmanniomyces endolithicus]KAK0953061.1 hypothetical protein LTS01_024554 [Friedmanniomyces endolithicus]KAK0963227.1 hypothetical protein LTR91_019092 [Friedmanniomyces endolithicus]KAK1026871.1 hypothetical protein LTS16_021976 [Friedmanniomyces endolithicus]
MANKKLSSHAASVLSRYNTRDSIASHVSARQQTDEFADPIKAEICGLSDHQQYDVTSVVEHPDLKPHVAAVEEVEIGVCPMRFMDQYSPEEVATYFEKHKHELPRSHEVCVRRYQSNEEQIRELDAKYGNLVSMIQGLCAKHKELLPHELAKNVEDEEDGRMDTKSEEKVRKWARSVSAQAVDGNDVVLPHGHHDEEDRRSHFDRPLRDIRVGESPSRPWGISVPAKYLEAAAEGSETSSRPAQPAPAPRHSEVREAKATEAKTKGAPPAAARCPFGFDQQAAAAMPAQHDPIATGHAPKKAALPLHHSTHSAPQHERPQQQQPAFVASSPPVETKASSEQQPPRVLFTGPVFIGYGAEDTARILRESGWGGRP